MQIFLSYLKTFLIYYFGVWLLYVVPAYVQYGCHLLGFEGPFRTGYMGNAGIVIEWIAVAAVGIGCCWATYRQQWQFHPHIFARRQNSYPLEVRL